MSPAIVSVFISSSSFDLSEERETIQQTLRKLREGNFLGKEYFGGREIPGRHSSIDDVEKSQVYILIIGGIYGTGIIEVEYRWARERNVPCFVYFKDEEPYEHDPGRLERLVALKKEIELNHSVTRFSTPEELGREIRSDLYRWYFDKQLTYSCATAAIGNINIIDGNHPHRLEVGTEYGAILYSLQESSANLRVAVSAPDLPFSKGLIGRDDEIGFAKCSLENGTPALFFGPSGIGKSAMLLELALQYQPDQFPDGFVHLTRVGNKQSGDVLQMIFQSFFETDTPLKCAQSELEHFLCDKRALVLLDDVEMEDREIVRVMRTLPDSAFAFSSTERRLDGIALQIELLGLIPEKAIALFSRELGRRLELEELMVADTLCVALDGNPQHILMVAALVRENPSHLAEIGSKPNQEEVKKSIAALTLSSLTAHEKKVLAALGAANGAALAPETISKLTGVPGIVPILESLSRRKLIENFGHRYYLPETLKEYLPQIWDLTDWYQLEIEHFLSWVENHRLKPGRVQEEWDTIFAAPDWIRAAGRSTKIIRLGRALDHSLALSGQWDLWDETLRKVLLAAQMLEDRENEAWALHQLGTRALCNGDDTMARHLLSEAFELRISLNDHAGASVTQHNLDSLRHRRNEEAVAGTSSAVFESNSEEGVEESNVEPESRPEPSGRIKAYLRLPAFQRFITRLVPIGAVVLLFAMTMMVVSFLKDHSQRPKDLASFAPNWLSVAGQQIYTESVPYEVIFTNEQSSALTIGQVAIGGEAAGDFRIAENDCLNKSLDPRGNCKISLIFSPTAAGARTAALSVNMGNGQKAAELKLTGTAIEELTADGIIATISTTMPLPSSSQTLGGTSSPSALSITPRVLTFETVEQGKGSRALIVIKNESAAATTISGLKIIGPNADDFNFSDICSRRLDPNKSCVLKLDFSPKQAGDREAAILITTNSSTAPQYVAMRGTAISTAPRIEAVPGRIDFGLAVAKSAASQQIVSIRNSGASPVSINSISLADDSVFSFNDVNCRGRAINPGDSCSISLGFKTKGDGDFNTSLIIRSNAQNNPFSIPIEGRVQLIISKTPNLVLYPNNLRLSFTGTPSNDRKLARGLIRLSNQGQAPFTIKDVGVDGADSSSFKLSHKCKGAQIEPEGNCDIEVVFEPAAGSASERRARLVVTANGGNTPQTMLLYGAINPLR